MEKLVSFFEIPASDFDRAVSFYEHLFNFKFEDVTCTETEKMAFFPLGEGAISFSEHIKPSSDGVLISLKSKNLEESLKEVVRNGGSIVIPKTEIECEGMGFFAVFIDSEGNKIGLHETE